MLNKSTLAAPRIVFPFVFPRWIDFLSIYLSFLHWTAAVVVLVSNFSCHGLAPGFIRKMQAAMKWKLRAHFQAAEKMNRDQAGGIQNNVEKMSSF